MFGHDTATKKTPRKTFNGFKLSLLKPVKFIFELICCDSLGREVPASDNLREYPPAVKNIKKRVL
jgi:hypothetical protein